jgi:hypothetical protein
MYRQGRGVRKDAATAFLWTKKAAEQGDVVAQNDLGTMYLTGLGVARDDAAAFAWTKKSAERGLGIAQLHLGLMYFKGEGVAEDKRAAFTWTQKAAEQGEVEAQTLLGAMYLDGDGVAKDAVTGLIWLHKATAQGSIIAKEKIDSIMNKADEARREALEYKPIAFDDFELDAGNRLPYGKRVAVTGLYGAFGQMEVLSRDLLAATQNSNSYKIVLITNNAPREVRKRMIELKSSPCGMASMCKIAVSGYIDKCNVTWLGARVRATSCLVVDDFRYSQ